MNILIGFLIAVAGYMSGQTQNIVLHLRERRFEFLIGKGFYRRVKIARLEVLPVLAPVVSGIVTMKA